MQSTRTVIMPVCTCCAVPSPLAPRDDLPGELAVCLASGQLYRSDGAGYVPATMPALASRSATRPGVQIDLSRIGYA
jgi:hypothetical protein